MKVRSAHVPGELLVRYHKNAKQVSAEGSPFAELGNIVARYPLTADSRVQEGGQDQEILHLKLNDDSEAQLEEAIKSLSEDPRIAYAVTNDIVSHFGREVTPNDLHKELYGMRNIQAPQGWADTTGDRSEAPLIGVVDSGIDTSHPDLQANLWTNPNEILNGIDDDGNGIVDDIHGYDAAEKDGNPSDSGTHGTHVAGTVGAVGNNGKGVVGVAWQAQMVALKFLAGGTGTMADAIAALTYGDSVGVRITQNSWGGTNQNQALVDTLKASPALHICAAGNDGNDSDVKPLFPAAYNLENIVSVAATDSEDKLAKFSNFGSDSVDLAAPGVAIYSTVPGEDYGFKSGTSMATPHVSGAASLVLTKFPELSNTELKDRLMFSTDRLTQLEGKVVSGGRLNLARALENDPVAPSTPQKLNGEATSPHLVRLNWIASGDDGMQGRVSAYEIAYSNKPFEESDFALQQQLRTLAPKEPGQQESAHLNLTPSANPRELFVAMRAVDNVGNRSALQTTRVQVPEAPVAFEDAPDNWTAEGAWGQQLVEGRGMVWSDSPNGFYERDQNRSLTSKSFSLSHFQDAKLQFDCRHDLEINFDKIHLEVSQDPDKKTWKTLESYNLLEGWHTRQVDLTEFAGSEDVQIRFRLKTDGDVHKDGFLFDRLVVTGTPREESQA